MDGYPRSQIILVMQRMMGLEFLLSKLHMVKMLELKILTTEVNIFTTMSEYVFVCCSLTSSADSVSLVRSNR